MAQQQLKFGFNPRSRVGNDRNILRNLGPKNVSFNPRSRVGNDVANAIAFGDIIVSIHVPA